MNMYDDIRTYIEKVIREETAFLKHYEAQVVDNLDTLSKGRVKVVIPELGFDTPDIGMWCFPRQGNSMNVPDIGDWVEIYFLKGDRNHPRYLHFATEMSGSDLSSYDGQPTTKVIWEDKDTGDHLKYNRLTKDLDFKFSGKFNVTGPIKINLLNAAEAFINGTTFNTWITGTLKTLYDAHTHVYNPGPGAPIASSPPATPLTAPSGHLSTKIFGE